MRKAGILILCLGIAAALSVSCSKQEKSEILTVYAYDSFVSEWGPGPILEKMFAEETGIKVKIVSAGDAGQAFARVLMEEKSPKADLLIGLDSNLLPKALSSGLFEPYRPEAYSSVPAELWFDSTFTVIPYDFGAFAFIYDSEKIIAPPRSLEDLTDPRFSKSIIIMDPRTSSPGLGFLLWTVAAYGEEYLDYWKRLKPSILTITEGWDSGYGLFTSGEAPLVLSYSTSPAYHLEYEETERYKAAVFPGGHYPQIEGIALVARSSRKEEAKAFIEFLLSTEAQEVIPLTNWMFPVSEKAKLPDSYRLAPRVKHLPLLPNNLTEEKADEWVEKWVEILSR